MQSTNTESLCWILHSWRNPKGSSNWIKPNRWLNSFSSKVSEHSEVWGIPLSIKCVPLQDITIWNTCHHNGSNHLNISHSYILNYPVSWFLKISPTVEYYRTKYKCIFKWNLHGLKVENIFKQIYNMQADKAGKRPFKCIIKKKPKNWLFPENFEAP